MAPESSSKFRRTISCLATFARTGGIIHYQNPKIVVGSVPEYQGRILISCKRGIEPRLGHWTIPAGFMENDETLEAGAAREAMRRGPYRRRDRQPAARRQCHAARAKYTCSFAPGCVRQTLA